MMQQRKLDSIIGANSAVQPTLALATVVGRADEWLLIAGIPSCTRARSAASCLVMPEIGDTVLVCDTGSELSAYILSVLIRATPTAGTVVLPGGAAFESEAGNLQIQAKSLEMHASKELTMASPKFSLNALVAELRVRKLSGWYESVETQAGKIGLMAQAFTSNVGRIVQKAKESFRWTEKTDETRAGRVRIKTEGHYSVHSRHTSMQSEGVVRIDGEKIDLG
jgi:hypothetical protein